MEVTGSSAPGPADAEPDLAGHQALAVGGEVDGVSDPHGGPATRAAPVTTTTMATSARPRAEDGRV